MVSKVDKPNNGEKGKNHLNADEMIKKALESKISFNGKEISLGKSEYIEIKKRLFEQKEKISEETRNNLEKLARAEGWIGLANKLKGVEITPEASKDITLNPETFKSDFEGMKYTDGKTEKMKKNPENMLRGSIELYQKFLNENVNNPDLSGLSKIKIPTHGDAHLEQLIFINGVPKLSDFDESHMDGTPLNDLMRVISSITVSGGNETQVTSFLNNYKKNLKGEITTLPKVPDGIKVSTKETQEDLTNGTNKFCYYQPNKKSSKNGRFFNFKI